jgi:F420 biosynthesis protein FbiB-like protein
VADLLRDALWAPSPHHTQPWRFTVLFELGEKQRLAVAMAERLAEELQADGAPAEVVERQTGRSRWRISSAPVVVLCSLVAEGLVTFPDRRRNELEWQMAVQSVGAALQTLFLTAHARGVGSCWMAAPMYCPDVVRAALRLPASYEPQALALLGYPAGPGKVRERRPVEEVVDLR